MSQITQYHELGFKIKKKIKKMLHSSYLYFGFWAKTLLEQYFHIKNMGF